MPAIRISILHLDHKHILTYVGSEQNLISHASVPQRFRSIYDDLSQLLAVTHALGSTTLDGASYSYDDINGNHTGYRQSKTDLASGITSNYAYNPIHQLTGLNVAE